MTAPALPLLSTVPAVRAELVRRLRADVFTGDTQTDREPFVTYGNPGRHIPDRYVAVHTVQDDVQRAIKRLPHDLSSSIDEEYTLDLVLWSEVRSQHDQDAQQLAVEDVFGWARRIDRHLRTDQSAWTLGGLVTHCYLARLTPDDFALAEGRASQLVVHLDVKAARI